MYNTRRLQLKVYVYTASLDPQFFQEFTIQLCTQVSSSRRIILKSLLPIAICPKLLQGFERHLFTKSSRVVHPAFR